MELEREGRGRLCTPVLTGDGDNLLVEKYKRRIVQHFPGVFALINVPTVDIEVEVEEMPELEPVVDSSEDSGNDSKLSDEDPMLMDIDELDEYTRNEEEEKLIEERQEN